MRCLLLSVTGLIVLGHPVRADMASPLSRSVEVRTVVTLAEPMPDYLFFARDEPVGRHTTPITFEVGKPTVVDAYGYRGTVLFAVPKALVGQLNQPEEGAEANRWTTASGVSSVELPKHLDVSIDGIALGTERHVTIRRGPDGVAFEVVRTPRSTGSLCLIFAGLAVTAAIVRIGIRWARRRKA